MLRVAVKLPAGSGRIGDYVADVTALEAAGADSIWLDASGAPTTEPWILLGAIAAVAHRARLGVIVGSATGWSEAVETLGRLSGGRVVVGMRPHGGSRISSPLPPSVLIMCSTPGEAERSRQMGDGVIFAGGDGEVRALRAKQPEDARFEIWIDTSVPGDRAGWANMVAALEAAGATGVMVPWDPRIIDLLRNAGDPDDRTDLLIAAG